MGKDKRKKNLLNYVPYIPAGVEYRDGILYSTISRGPFSKLYLRLARIEDRKKTYLDDVGRFVIERIDGRKSVREIAEELKEEFGERVDPVYQTLAIFLKQLSTRGLIRFYFPSGEEKNVSGGGDSAEKR
ncbi:PqqD family protein [Candidatus Acetothermia bacterium]|nr:MAG: PqqD family protein [Candidatus Acetothermia bacterium]